jgi:hypothetical protein
MGVVLCQFSTFVGFWSFELQFFGKFVNFNEVFQFLYDLFCHERLNLQLRLKMKLHH